MSAMSFVRGLILMRPISSISWGTDWGIWRQLLPRAGLAMEVLRLAFYIAIIGFFIVVRSPETSLLVGKMPAIAFSLLFPCEDDLLATAELAEEARETCFCVFGEEAVFEWGVRAIAVCWITENCLAVAATDDRKDELVAPTRPPPCDDLRIGDGLN